MKDIAVKINNVWDDYGNEQEYDVVIFHVPDKLEINIEEESDILECCHSILNDYYNCDEKEYLSEAFEDYPNVTPEDLEYAKTVLGRDGSYGIITERLAEFIERKYQGVTWEMQNYDFEIDLE